MKSALLALLLICSAPLAHAAPATEAPHEGADYWRHPANGQEAEWRPRAEYHDEVRHEEWVHAHCVRDWQNQEYCRR